MGYITFKAKCVVCRKMFDKKNDAHTYCSKECMKVAHEKSRARFVILNRDGFKCAYCGFSSYEDLKELHVDHIVPRDEGGTSHASNLITACLDCNVSKHTMKLSNETEILAEVARRNKKCGILGDLIIKLKCND